MTWTASHARRLQRQDRGADIAAHLGVEAGTAHQMRDQRRGSRFAVGAGDGDERRVRRVAAPLAAEQLDVADHLDAGLARASARVQCGPGWVSGTPGVSTSAAKFATSRCRAQVRGR